MAETNSVNSQFSRYVWGGSTTYENDKLGWWERHNLDYDSTDQDYIIEKKYEKMGYAKLAAVIYGNPSYGTLILQFNNILDPMTEFLAGKTISLPKPERVISYVSMGVMGGVKTD